jgi:UPF0755 protein
MYFKKLLLLASMIGLLIAGYISYQIYGVIFNPNTNFEQGHVLIRIQEEADLEKICNAVEPFLKNPESFRIMAKKRALHRYSRPGVFKIEKGMSNNEIIDVLTAINRSN